MADHPRILVDSCVWVDNYLGDNEHFEESYAFIRAAREHGAELLYGASKLEVMFSTLEHEFGRTLRERGLAQAGDANKTALAFAWGCIDNIRVLGTAVGVDEADLWMACKYRSVSPSLADNTLLAAAERAKVDYLVTWDERLLTMGMVRAATPNQMVTILSMEA